MPSESNILAVGATAPDFTLPSSTGRDVSLADYAGRKTVVLYFYPKAFTPGCTTEACGLRDSQSDFDKDNVQVLGISPDSQDEVKKFAETYHLDFPLLADVGHKVADQYGVWQMRMMMGKSSAGIARTTFIIDKDGKIVHVFEHVKPSGHDQEILRWLHDNSMAG